MGRSPDNDLKPPSRWPSVLAKLEAAKPKLLKGGAVVARRSPGRKTVWVVRFREWEAGRVRRKTIYVGGAALAERARALIRIWREETLTPVDRVKRDILKLADVRGELAGLSGRARKRLRAANVEGLQDPFRLCAMAFGAFPVFDPRIRNGRLGGRPPKSAMW